MNQSKFKSSDVHNVVCHIPEGRVTSYGAISIFLTGNTKSSQTVGSIIKRLCEQYSLEEVPVHRVIFKCGRVPNEKNVKALKKEGARISHGRYKFNTTECFWEPK